uniref:BPTI/Kunitz inhibitor domain-containing protein n=1 Tax=Mesocestoides corti TaxID=53468 RepID=A0A5K3FZK1_MESCO
MRCQGSYPDPFVSPEFQGCGIVLTFHSKENQTIIRNLNKTYMEGKQMYDYTTNTCNWSCSYFKTVGDDLSPCSFFKTAKNKMVQGCSFRIKYVKQKLLKVFICKCIKDLRR